jgi:hypothetical protein
MAMKFALAGLALLALSPVASAAPSSGGRVEFEVLRNGQPFGRHVVQVRESGGRFSVESRADLRAVVGPVTVFRYEHACTETWDAGALAALTCSTLRNGRRTRVEAVSEGGGLRVAGARGETEFPSSALPTSWWTKPAANVTSMIDTETGARMPLRVTHLGRETIDAGGARIEADHVRVQGTLTVDLWYDAQGRWVGCAFTASGQRVVYRLATPRTSGPA